MSVFFKTADLPDGYGKRVPALPAREHLLLLDGPPAEPRGRFVRTDPGFAIHPVAVRPELARHVAAVCTIEPRTETLTARPALDVLPGTGTSLCVSYGARFEHGTGGIAPSSVCGIFGHTRSYVPAAGSGVVMVSFQPGALQRFVRAPADELADRETLAADLWGRLVSELEERVAGADSNVTRGRLVQDFLQGQLGGVADGPVNRMARSIIDDGGRTPVRALAETVGLSERQFERRFTSAIGTRPKRFARLARFHRALSIARTGLGWAEVAFQSGFSDQSHLTREFVSLAGATPEALAARARVPVNGVSDSFNRGA